MLCTYSYLLVNFYKRLDGAVSITVVLEKSENKVEGSSPRLRVRVPVKPFLIFLFSFAFTKMQKIFATYIFAKKHVLLYYAHIKRLH